MIAGGRYEPVTSEIGFVRQELDVVATLLSDTRREAGYTVTLHGTDDGLAAIRWLEPLQPSPPRELLIACENGWIAYFNCSMLGTDATPAMAWLSIQNDLRTLVVSHIAEQERGARPACYRFILHDQQGAQPLNVLRAVANTFDIGRWDFQQEGEVQDFEEPERYRERRKRDRLTGEMLVRYMDRIGIRYMDDTFYGSSGYVLNIDGMDRPRGSESGPVLEKRSIVEAQRYFEIPVRY